MRLQFPSVLRNIVFLSFILFLPAADPFVSARQATTDPKVTLTDVSVAQLIDDLVNVDAQTAGLHGTALVNVFIADGSPAKFGGGVLGSGAPKDFPQMKELVRRGASSLPLLIAHLDDTRATKLIVGGEFFWWAEFTDAYDPKEPGRRWEAPTFEKRFEGTYTVRVGDVCYALIGQIVNREFLAVRYQPTGGLIVSSPIEAPILIEKVKRDWGGVNAEGLMVSLLGDAQTGKNLYDYQPALRRLRFYFPTEYAQQATGSLKKKIKLFEADEKKQK